MIDSLSSVDAARTITVDGFDYEVDSYSIVDGSYTEDFNVAGGTIVLRGRVDGTPTTATVSAANLPQALGHALLVLLRETPNADLGSVSITGYVDSETGELMPIDRSESP